MKQYPEDYTTTTVMKDGIKVVLRPIEPEDFKLEKKMFTKFSKETQRMRFFTYINKVTSEMIRRYTDVDKDVEVGIMAEIKIKGKSEMAGVVRLITDEDGESGEMAIVVADPWQKKGLGSKMIDHITEIACKRGLHKIHTFTLPDNFLMQKMLKKKKFRIKDNGDHIFAEKDI